MSIGRITNRSHMGMPILPEWLSHAEAGDVFEVAPGKFVQIWPIDATQVHEEGHRRVMEATKGPTQIVVRDQTGAWCLADTADVEPAITVEGDGQ